MRIARRALPVAAVLWAVSIVVAPWSASVQDELGVARLAGAATYAVGHLVCHQLPERSFHANEFQWPVCARCSGLYLSAALGVVGAWVARRRVRALPFAAWRGILVIAAVPTGVTLGLEWWDPRWSSGLVRALAAVPLGAALGVLLAASLSFQGRLSGCEPTR